MAEIVIIKHGDVTLLGYYIILPQEILKLLKNNINKLHSGFV